MTNTVCILERNALTREGLKILLGEENYKIEVVPEIRTVC